VRDAVGHDLVGGLAGQLGALERHAARARRDEAGDGAQQGGLARAVGATTATASPWLTRRLTSQSAVKAP